MKTKYFLLITIYALALMTISCGRSQSPLSPQNDLLDPSNAATLTGNVEVTSSNVSLANIQIGIKGTNIIVIPNTMGDFQINNLPLGNPVIEVIVKDIISELPLENVQSREEIRIRLRVESNCFATLTHMERKKKKDAELTLQIRPKKWNLDWTESNDEVVARIYGEGHDTIQTESVEIYGPDGVLMIANDNLEIEIGGVYFKAKFPQSDAIGLIQDPLSGMPYEIAVKGTYGEDELPFELMDTIVIVGKKPRDEEELSIQVNPTKWNTNWTKSSGTVMVKFWGEGYDQIDSSAVRMIGPEDFDEIGPATRNLTDDHLIVKFFKKDAIKLIPDPIPGDIHVLRIVDGLSNSFEFEFVIEIVGPKK